MIGKDKASFSYPIILIAFLVLTAVPATADIIRVIDFEEDASSNPIVGGQIIDDEYAAWGVNIEVENFHRSFHLGIAYDSHTETGGDSDLVRGALWAAGNAQSEDFGNLLIISERSTLSTEVDANGDPIIAVPDDEGGRPAGTLSFLFDDPVDSVGFALIDVEGDEELVVRDGDGNIIDFTGFMATFNGGGGSAVMTFFDLGMADETIVWGNRSANRIEPISADDLGLSYIDSVVFQLGGSGALGEVRITQVPEPGSMGLLGLGLAATLLYSNRYRNRS